MWLIMILSKLVHIFLCQFCGHRKLEFGRGQSSHMLICATSDRITSWNMLSCHGKGYRLVYFLFFSIFIVLCHVLFILIFLFTISYVLFCILSFIHVLLLYILSFMHSHCSIVLSLFMLYCSMSYLFFIFFFLCPILYSFSISYLFFIVIVLLFYPLFIFFVLSFLHINCSIVLCNTLY